MTITLSWVRLLKATIVTALVAAVFTAGVLVADYVAFTSFDRNTRGICFLRILTIFAKDKVMQQWAEGCMEMGGTPGWYFSFDGSLAGPRCEGVVNEEE